MTPSGSTTWVFYHVILLVVFTECSPLAAELQLPQGDNVVRVLSVI